jgi:hypothetical protein
MKGGVCVHHRSAVTSRGGFEVAGTGVKRGDVFEKNLKPFYKVLVSLWVD